MNSFLDSVGSSISSALASLRGGGKVDVQLNLEEFDSEVHPQKDAKKKPKTVQGSSGKLQSTSWADLMEDDDIDWEPPQATTPLVGKPEVKLHEVENEPMSAKGTETAVSEEDISSEGSVQAETKMENEVVMQMANNPTAGDSQVADEPSSDLAEDHTKTAEQGWTPVKKEQKMMRLTPKPVRSHVAKEGLNHKPGHRDVTQQEHGKPGRLHDSTRLVTPSKSIALSQASTIQSGVTWAARVRGLPPDATVAATPVKCEDAKEDSKAEDTARCNAQAPNPEPIAVHKDQPMDAAPQPLQDSVTHDASSHASPAEDSVAKEIVEPQPVQVHSLMKTPNAWKRGHREISQQEHSKPGRLHDSTRLVTPSKSIALSQASTIQSGVTWAARVRGLPPDATVAATPVKCEDSKAEDTARCDAQAPNPGPIAVHNDEPSAISHQPVGAPLQPLQDSVSHDSHASPVEEIVDPQPVQASSPMKTPNAWKQGPPRRFRKQPAEETQVKVSSPESVNLSPGYTPQRAAPDEWPSHLCWADRIRGTPSPNASHTLLEKAKNGRHITFQGHQFPPPGWIPSPYISTKKSPATFPPSPFCHPAPPCDSPMEGKPVRLQFSDADNEMVMIDPNEAAVWVGSLKIRINNDKWLCEHFGPYSLTRVLERGDGYAILQFPQQVMCRVMEVFQGYRVDGRKMVLRPSKKYIPTPQVSVH